MQSSVDVITRSGATPESVVKFEALVRLRVEQSRVSFNPNISTAMVRQAVMFRPEGKPLIEWPPQVQLEGTDLLITALTKMLLVVEAGTQFRSRSAAAIRNALDERFPLASKAEKESDTKRFAAFGVTATIWREGNAQWAYHTESQGELPPGVSAENSAVQRPAGIKAYKRSDLEMYLQDHARVDILTRLDQLMR